MLHQTNKVLSVTAMSEARTCIRSKRENYIADYNFAVETIFQKLYYYSTICKLGLHSNQPLCITEYRIDSIILTLIVISTILSYDNKL